jgi:arylsulfatase
MAAPDRPNILLFLADQHRWDCLGAYGHPDVETPNIDRIASDGVRYENCFCPYPVCTPSRYSLLTGLYVRQHMGWTNHCTLPPALPTFPRILREAGYRTAAVGKMHFTPTYLDVGFERMELAEQDGLGRFDDDYHRYLRERHLVDRIDLIDQRSEYRQGASRAYWECFGAAESDLPEEHHCTTWIGDRAVEAVRQWAGGGNFLMVGFVKPHHPFDPPAPWSRMYAPDAVAMPPGWTAESLPGDLDFHTGYFPNASLTEPALRRIMAMYYATISQIDHHVGRMLDLLAERGLYDDTMIVYTADHGDYMGFHHMILKGGLMYDPLVKVPLIVKYPGGSSAAATGDALVSNLDLAPTILAQAGCEPAETMAGLDLATRPQGRELIFAEGWRNRQYMVRSRTQKLLLCREGRHNRYFDLAADPLEMDDLFSRGDRQREIEALKQHLLRWSLHDAVTPTYLDEHASTIDAPNVCSPATGGREDMIEYLRQEMEKPHADPFAP